MMNVCKYLRQWVMEHMPLKIFHRCVQTYNGNHKVKSFSCLDQFLCMDFAQLTYRESLRETEVCLRAQNKKLYHMGIRGGIARNTLSNANKVRDWRIYADFAQALIKIARPLYADEDLGLELTNTIYAFDSSTIKLCLSVFPWALFRSTKSAIKLHTLLDIRGNIPSFIHITEGKIHDVNVLDILILEAGAFYIMDRGYLDFSRLFNIDQAGAFFIIRAKTKMVYRRQYSHSVTAEEKSRGIRCDQTIVLAGVNSKTDYPQQMRRIKYYDINNADQAVSATPNAMILFNPVLVTAVIQDYPELSSEKREKLEKLEPRLGAEPESMSPYHNVKAGLPPSIIFHGKDDPTVAYQSVELFTEQMNSAGNRCELVGYEDQRHGFFNYGKGDGSAYTDTMRRTDEFLVSLGWLTRP